MTSVSLSIPRYPAVGPHTVGPQRPLGQRTAGCRTTWPVAPRAGRSSRIQSLQRVKHNFMYGAVCKTGDPETVKLRGEPGSMRENVQNKGVLWPRVWERLRGVCRFCIMHYVSHIFVRWGNGSLNEVTSLGDLHELINAALWLVVRILSKNVILIFRGTRQRRLTRAHWMLTSSHLLFINIQLKAACSSASLYHPPVLPSIMLTSK